MTLRLARAPREGSRGRQPDERAGRRQRPPTRAPARRQRPPAGRLRAPALLVLAVLLAGTVDLTRSVGRALTRPGTDSTAARLAEWGRDNHLGFAVDWLERRSYTPPKVGGAPAGSSPLALPGRVGAPRAGANQGGGSGRGARALPARLVPFAAPALPGEGSWSSLAVVGGRTAMAAAFLRPDAVHTSYTSGVVWWDPARVHAALHPGTLDPGGSGWSQPSDLPSGARSRVVAAFNSGFRLASSLGGYYADGRTVRALLPGAASMVFHRDGTLTIGAWGSEVSMTADVTAVRQNLALMVDRGAVVAGVADNAGNRWGATLGAAKYVWRSGIGMRADASLVYVAGDRLSAATLAGLLLRAGSVRGMELDINPEWTSFVRYTATGPVNLLPDMQNTPRRYDTPSSRDFLALARP